MEPITYHQGCKGSCTITWRTVYVEVSMMSRLERRQAGTGRLARCEARQLASICAAVLERGGYEILGHHITDRTPDWSDALIGTALGT